jgi:hypothetical protein
MTFLRTVPAQGSNFGVKVKFIMYISVESGDSKLVADGCNINRHFLEDYHMLGERHKV